jgi:hypothetical protein
MRLRRWPLAAALALPAGILAHGMLFGLSHALGGAHEAEIVQLGVLAVALFSIAALTAGALRDPRLPIALARRFAGPGGLLRATAFLGVGAAASFAAIEFLEGRLPFEHLAAAPAILLAAFLVAWAARAAAGALARAGAFLATLCVTPATPSASGAGLTGAFVPVRIAASTSRGARRGRAPPRPA